MVRNALSLLFTGLLVICALVITGLAGVTVFRRYWSPDAALALRVAPKQPNGSGSHRLPELSQPPKLLENPRVLSGSATVRGFPLVPEFATIVPIANRDMVFLPILMNEEALPIKLRAAIVDPRRWGEPTPFSDSITGRRSLWYMEVGSTMLYGIAIDPQFEAGKIGLGFVVVKRLNEDTYDVLMEDADGNTLFAARGKLIKIDSTIGRGTLSPVENQDEVRRHYRPRWDIPAQEFVLFSAH